MFADQHTAQLRQSFEKHFEPDGAGFLYRARPRAAPIRITALERQAFIDNYARSLKRWYYLFLIAQVLLWGLFVLLMIHASEAIASATLYGGLAIMVVGFVVVLRDVRRAPAKALKGRAPVGPERTKDEAAKATLAQIGWSQLATAALAGIGLPFIVQAKSGPLDGWNRLWFVAGGALVFVAIVQAARKWRVS